MAQMLYTSILSWLDVRFTPTRGAKDDQLLLWAKTEYGNDWRYAYQVMRDTGDGPRYKHKFETGITQ
jgi:hypothetical protein